MYSLFYSNRFDLCRYCGLLSARFLVIEYVNFFIIHCFILFFFFNDTATTEIYTLSLHDALPISQRPGSAAVPAPPASAGPEPGRRRSAECRQPPRSARGPGLRRPGRPRPPRARRRSEEHTSELQSRQYLVCRLLLEKKKKQKMHIHRTPEMNTVRHLDQLWFIRNGALASRIIAWLHAPTEHHKYSLLTSNHPLLHSL